MATRGIVKLGENILRERSREVTVFDGRLSDLIDDMFETMYEANGVGLAAVQVGVLKRIFVVDVTGEDPYIFVNPKILETSGEQSGQEGCLSVPGKTGIVTRPNYVKIAAYNENMEYFELEGEELLARAICHEYDHLDGHLYVEHIDHFLTEEELEEYFGEEDGK